MSDQITPRKPYDFTPAEEASARRVAKRLGFRVCKSRERSQHFNNQGGLQLLDGNAVIEGVNFDCTPEEIIYFAEKHHIS